MKQDKEAVKVLALQHGVREAARLCNLPEYRVLKWSQRDPLGAWTVQKQIAQLTPIKGNHTLSSTSSSPSDALRSTLTERSNQTKLGLSKAAAKAAEHLAQSEPIEILTRSRQMHDVAKTASTVHGWEAGAKDVGPFAPGSIQILSQRTYLNMGQAPEGE